MIEQTVLPFKLGITQDSITPHAGIALLGEFAYGLKIPEQIDEQMPAPGSGAGYSGSQKVQGKLFEDAGVRFMVIASNREESAEEMVAWYNQRGECSENRLKELKLGIGMERMPCGDLRANAVFFRIGALVPRDAGFELKILPEEWHQPRLWRGWGL